MKIKTKTLLAMLLCITVAGCAHAAKRYKDTKGAIKTDGLGQALIPLEFTYEGGRYYYDPHWKNHEQVMLGDLDNDDRDEIVISFAAKLRLKNEGSSTNTNVFGETYTTKTATTVDGVIAVPFCQIYKKYGERYKVVKTIMMNQYLGEVDIESFGKDGRKQLVIWSYGDTHHADLYIYEWLKGDYKLIFENGSTCGVELKTDKPIPEIWIGREQRGKEGRGYAEDTCAWEVYTWDGSTFAYNKGLSASPAADIAVQEKLK